MVTTTTTITGNGHDHDHEHEHEHEVEELDPAQQSLADALRVSFMLLKVIMAGLVILYVLSGILPTMPTTKAAVRLRFGEIVGEPGKQVIPTGGPYFKAPDPFEEVVLVDLSAQQMDLNQSFWWAGSPNDPNNTVAPVRALNPENDGFLITGDANIVHTRWSISYRIDKDDAVDYIRNVNDPDLLRHLVNNAAEEGIVFMVSHYTADQIIQGQIKETETREAIHHMQDQLNAIGAGVHIDSLVLTDKSMPGYVRQAYESVVNAVTAQAQNLEMAQQERNRVLGETAGEAYPGLWKIVRAYEHAVARKDAPEVARLDAQLDTAFRELNLGPDYDNLPITGKVAELINEADNYRSSQKVAVQSEANTFSAYYDKFKASPKLRDSHRHGAHFWQEAKEKAPHQPQRRNHLPAQQRIALYRVEPRPRRGQGHGGGQAQRHGPESRQRR